MVEIVPLVVGCLGGGMEKLEKQIQKTILMESNNDNNNNNMLKIQILYSSFLILNKSHL